MSYSKILYHVVFPTHRREPTLVEEHEGDLYAYIAGIVKKKGGFVHAIGGVTNHVHMVVEIPASLSPADFVKAIKQYSSVWLRDNKHFPHWDGWGRSYGVFSCSPLALEPVLRYVRNQKEHHAKVSFEEELKIVLSSIHIPYNDTRLR